MSKSGRDWRAVKIPFVFALTIPFVALTVMTVGLAGYLSFRNGRQAVNDVAHQLRGEITQSIKGTSGAFFSHSASDQ